jgi:hypothetical protein
VIVYDTSTSIQEFNEKALLIFPNPFQEGVTVEVPYYKNTQLLLTSMEGRLLQNITLKAYVTQLNMGDYSRGIYIVKVINEKGTYVRKIVKE